MCIYIYMYVYIYVHIYVYVYVYVGFGCQQGPPPVINPNPSGTRCVSRALLLRFDLRAALPWVFSFACALSTLSKLTTPVLCSRARTKPGLLLEEASSCLVEIDSLVFAGA